MILIDLMIMSHLPEILFVLADSDLEVENHKLPENFKELRKYIKELKYGKRN